MGDHPHIWHGEAQWTLFGPNMEARSYSLALHDVDTLMRLSESPQYWAMCCLHKHTVTLASDNLCLLLASPGCLMQQLTTVSKICNPKWQILNSPLKMWEIALPTPLRIDAPAHSTVHWVLLWYICIMISIWALINDKRRKLSVLYNSNYMSTCYCDMRGF